MNIIPNTYLDLTNICIACGFPVANTTSSIAKCCATGNKQKSCLNFIKNQSAKRRKKEEDDKHAEYLKDLLTTGQEAMRNCLGIGCMDKENRLFESKGPHNRQCPSCSNLKEGMDISNLSRIPGHKSNLPF